MVAARIGGDVATDGAASFRTQAERKQKSFRGGGILRLLERDASLGSQGHAGRAEVADAVHPFQAQQHFAMERNLAAHQAGVAALRHDMCSGLVADGQDRRDLLGALRLEQ
jgi:hypothetical protein